MTAATGGGGGGEDAAEVAAEEAAACCWCGSMTGYLTGSVSDESGGEFVEVDDSSCSGVTGGDRPPLGPPPGEVSGESMSELFLELLL